MTTSNNEPVRTGGLRSDGELVQAVSDHFEFRAPGGAGTRDSGHKDWINLMSVSQSVTEAEPFGMESLTLAHEALERGHDEAPPAPADDLL